MSKYVKQMKDTLVAFGETADRIHADMRHNIATYQPAPAADANARLQAELNKAAGEARDKIDAIHADAAAHVRQWAELSGAGIVADDLSLLKGDFHLSREDVWNLLVKHQDNATMVNAIAKYAAEHGITLDYVPNVGDKLFAYDSFAKSAHNQVGEIVSSGSQSDKSVSLSMWGEPGNISQRMELALFGIQKAEAPALQPPKGDFNFGFKSIEGRD